MQKILLMAAMMIASSAEVTVAQYVRPVEVVPPRPVTPMPNPVTPMPNTVSPVPNPAPPTVTAPPIAVVPGQPPVAAPGGKARPRKCWCYVRSPASNTAQRTTCEVECCKGNNQDERC